MDYVEVNLFLLPLLEVEVPGNFWRNENEKAHRLGGLGPTVQVRLAVILLKSTFVRKADIDELRFPAHEPCERQRDERRRHLADIERLLRRLPLGFAEPTGHAL